MEPAQKPRRSRQDWATPADFLAAVKRRLCIGRFNFDLAATAANRVEECYYGPESSFGTDALDMNWSRYDKGLWMWCNPPYTDIRPWVAKAADESTRGAQIAMLVPASTGSNWWRDHVVNDAYVVYLNGRLTFAGATAPYPKDCALLLYTPFIRSGSTTWNWRS